MKKYFLPLFLLLTLVNTKLPLLAQTIIPANDGTNTNININGNQIDINGGTLSADGANLFHSFTQFGLTSGQIANFLANPNLNNILGRITGGDPSFINGLIQVTGGNSNLFLMNPAGIIFGNNASLNVPADFTATTATGIGFNDSYFSAFGNNNYADLIGNPTGFLFNTNQVGSIINTGNLTVNNDQNLSLIGGTVINTGNLTANGGNINILAVPNSSKVILDQPGQILTLEIDLHQDQLGNTLNFTPLDLPKLLTGSQGLIDTQGIAINSSGNVVLTPSNTIINQGDICLNQANSNNIYVNASNNLNLIESQLTASNNLNLLAKNTVYIRDSLTNPVIINSGKDLYIQGNRGIDILTLNHLEITPFVSGGNLTFVSDGMISGDAHFVSGGNISFLDLTGAGGNFYSYYDPIISAVGDVTFGSYTGASLKVEATGSINITGDITINAIDTALCLAPNTCTTGSDRYLLGNNYALILKAGVTSLTETNSGNLPSYITSSASSPASVTVGNISMGRVGSDLYGGMVTIEATGNINTGNINADSLNQPPSLSNGNFYRNISLSSTQGNINTGNINTTSGFQTINTSWDRSSNKAGDVTLTANNGSITTGVITAEALTFDPGSPLREHHFLNNQGGNITIRSRDDITTNNISTTALSPTINGTTTINGGDINMYSSQGNITTRALYTSNGLIVFNYGTGTPTVYTQGGSVTLTLGSISPNNQIIFNYISTSARTPCVVGVTCNINTAIGGDVTINANNGTVRGISSYTDHWGNISTINSTATRWETNFYPYSSNTIFTDQGGTINIIYGGGATDIPFTIGDASLNGTAQSLRRGDTTLTLTSGSFPILPNGGNVTPVANINITSVNTPPSLTGNNNLGATTPGNFVTINYSNLNPIITDLNGDNTTLRVSSILTGGILKINGVIANIGDLIPTGATLEFTPPLTATGEIVGFSITANDNVSVSIPLDLKVTLPTPTPSNDNTVTPIVRDNSSLNDIFKEKDFEVNSNFVESTPDSENVFIPLVQTSINSDNVATSVYVQQADQTLTNSFNNYFGNIFNTNPITLEEVQTQLKNIEAQTGITAAIVHAIFVQTSGKNLQSNYQLQLTLTSPDAQPIIYKINVTKEEIIQLSQKLISSVTNIRRQNAYQQPSQQLYQWLIKPLEADLKQYEIEQISFVVDQGLRAIPWAALFDGEQFLIEKYSIAQMPSLLLTNLNYFNLKNSQVLAMGADTFTGQNPLPAVPMELELVSNQLWEGESYLNQDFSINQLINARNTYHYEIIHLATHGEFTQGNPENSYIQFQNERLSLNQLHTLGLNNPPVELMVLSACRSALGDKDAEMGFAGLAVLAGVKSALGSLWYISDAGTLGLVSEFYENLKTAPIKAEALRQTQIAMLKGKVRLENGKLITTNGDFPLTEDLKQLGDITLTHPYYWSAFTIIGNPW